MVCEFCKGTGRLGFQQETCWYCDGVGHQKEVSDKGEETKMNVYK
jgi:RecJ-like exonuclease